MLLLLLYAVVFLSSFAQRFAAPSAQKGERKTWSSLLLCAVLCGVLCNVFCNVLVIRLVNLRIAELIFVLGRRWGNCLTYSGGCVFRGLKGKLSRSSAATTLNLLAWISTDCLHLGLSTSFPDTSTAVLKLHASLNKCVGTTTCILSVDPSFKWKKDISFCFLMDLIQP